MRVVRPTRNAWLLWGRRLGVAAAGLALVLGLSALVPKRLPEPELPNRVLARPHRIAPGHDVEATHLIERVERLGYRRTRSASPGPGEYFRGEGRIVIHRREFQGPEGAVAPARFELRLDWGGRVAGIRDEAGRDRGAALLDPETLGALADDAPTDRVLVRPGELPRHLIDALLVVEDRRFYEHHGLDLRRLAGALISNVRARRVREGGSTITQQLVKNVFLTHERSVLRKLREAWLALRVERAHTKDEILEAYLNTIYLGQRGAVSVVGVEAAARHYFGQSARTLGLAESALLVGMIRGPGFYSPWTKAERALARRNRVLARMEKAGVVSEREAAAAAAAPLGNVATPPATPRSAWFLAKLERDLADALPDARPARRPRRRIQRARRAAPARGGARRLARDRGAREGLPAPRERRREAPGRARGARAVERSDRRLRRRAQLVREPVRPRGAGAPPAGERLQAGGAARGARARGRWRPRLHARVTPHRRAARGRDAAGTVAAGELREGVPAARSRCAARSRAR